MVVVFSPPSWKLFSTIHQIAKLPDESFQNFSTKTPPKTVWTHYAEITNSHPSQNSSLGLPGRWATFGKETLSSSFEHVGPNLQWHIARRCCKKKSTMRDPMSHMVDVGSMVGRGLSRTPQVTSVGEHFATKTTFMDPHLQQNIDRMWKEASLDSNPIKMMVPCIPQARLFHMRTYITVCMNIYLYTLRCWGSAGHTREGVGGGGVGMIYVYIHIHWSIGLLIEFRWIQTPQT